MYHRYSLLHFACVCLGTVTISDPSDTIDPADWAADNALVSLDDLGSTALSAPIAAGYTYNNTAANISHTTLENTANDTSVLLVTEGGDVNLDYSTIIKYGYSSSLTQSSFYGVNAAINVANDSIIRISHTNVTTHNGAANLYSYGNGSIAYVDNVWLYSSGPVAHGLYAGGNGTVYANNVQAYSGGFRSSVFSGDNPGGYVHVKDAVAHAAGIGSAVCYALGLCNMTNVVGISEKGPAMFSDGKQTGIWTNCDLTAGLLGGVVMFGSSERRNGASVTFVNSKLTVLGDTMPGLWFGNINATANIISTEINNTASGIIAVANFSRITPEFDHYGDYSDLSTLKPAILALNVEESDLTGDLVAYNESSINFSLAEYSTWTGTAYIGYGDAYLGVSIDATSNWTLTANTALQNFTDSDCTYSNIASNGFNITYQSDSTANAALNGGTYDLPGGGKLSPV